MKVAVPSWRPDVDGKADIVEEVVRIVGVDRVPPTPFERGDAPRKPVLTPLQVRTRKAKRALAARGLVEAVTWSFISKPQAELFGGGEPELALANPIAADLSDMRPSLIPGLVAAAQKNADRGYPDVGAVRGRADFQGRPAGGSVHRRHRRAPRRCRKADRHRTALVGGNGASASMPSTPRPMRWRCSPPPARRSQALQIVPGGPAWFHPGRSGTIQIGPAERARPFRRIASARAGSARRRGPDRRPSR